MGAGVAKAPAPLVLVRSYAMRAALEQLEASSADPRPALAFLAGHELERDHVEVYGALRRAELLLAAGGDPRREIDLSDRAVSTVADDLGTPELWAELAARLRALEPDAEDLPAIAEALRQLGKDPELAWRIYAWALLTEHVADEV